ncbi:PREDICTED: uncharacterized protein CG3556 isoform X2 [Nicrophorus vespilloides]|uniref:Uncharacterized protein CG3556 isoform X2 n=1 Tax=Nicrophorus vespilloides TaxID=110193 RepID=A0ABM1M3I1_NICVS|nr:PREDICTED: uncharacterized protein CG3556 isoform X2 [Nicrophorus vespilloides]
MLYVPLIVGFSLVAFGYTQDLELQPAYNQSIGTKQLTTEAAAMTPPQMMMMITTTTTTTTDFNFNTSAPVEYETSMQRALAWLVTQRNQDYGWNNDTAKVLMALQLVQLEEATIASIVPAQLEMQLSMKQLEVEIVILLWRHHEIPITPPKLAQYTLALNSLCQDPRQFHGHDLIGTLQHHEPPHDLDFAYATLAACSSKAHVRKKQIRRLLDIANTANDHNIDTVSMTIIALKCIVKDHRHRNLQHSIRRPCISLGRQQMPDGGFGNVYNTALALQALQDVSDIGAYWNRTAAILYLESKQDPDGAFTDAGLTADVVLALNSKGLGNIRSLECDGHESDLENHVELDGITKSIASHMYNDSDPRNITVSYTLWVGTNVSENYTVWLTALRNTSFYSIMQMAADADPHYNFEASEWPNGHYVHTLAGYKEEPMGYHYWLLYRLPELPDPQTPPANQLVAPVGVDDLLIEEGDHYLFWYKKL